MMTSPMNTELGSMRTADGSNKPEKCVLRDLNLKANASRRAGMSSLARITLTPRILR